MAKTDSLCKVPKKQPLLPSPSVSRRQVGQKGEQSKPQHCLLRLRVSRAESSTHSSSPGQTSHVRPSLRLAHLSSWPQRKLQVRQRASVAPLRVAHAPTLNTGWVLRCTHLHFLRRVCWQEVVSEDKNLRPAWARLRMPWKESKREPRLLAHTCNPNTGHLCQFMQPGWHVRSCADIVSNGNSA